MSLQALQGFYKGGGIFVNIFMIAFIFSIYTFRFIVSIYFSLVRILCIFVNKIF